MTKRAMSLFERRAGRQKRGVLGRLWARFGQVAKQLGHVKDEDVSEALEHQQKRKGSKGPHRKIGHILVEQGKITGDQVKEVLKEQKRAADEEEMTIEEVQAFLKSQEKTGSPKKPAKAKKKAKAKAVAKPKKKAEKKAKAKKKAAPKKKKAKKKAVKKK